MKTMTQEEIEIAIRIGKFFFILNERNVEKTQKALIELRISGIKVTDEITIILSRPGLLIGKKGSTIEQLQKFLGRTIIIKEDETSIYDNLMVFMYNAGSDYDGENFEYRDDVKSNRFTSLEF